MKQPNLIRFFENSIRENWDQPALSDYNGRQYLFKEVAADTKWIHGIFESYGIQKGDKIALIGKNSAEWAVAFIAIVSYGAVVVPVLPDFKPKDVHHIVTHSDARLLFASSHLYPSLDFQEMELLEGVIILKDLSLADFRKEKIKKTYDKVTKAKGDVSEATMSKDDFNLPEIELGDLAAISYTSGTTGFSKGVMLDHKSLTHNVVFAQDNMPLESGDRIVSFLPLAHAYGLAFEFLFPFSIGCHIIFLTKTPSPQIITQAFQEVRPRLILSVPLVIEKIFKKRIKPQIEKPLVSLMLKIPVLNKLVYNKILKGLSAGFGGNFEEVVIGGAALNNDIERLFKKIGFPFTIGYGMTECGPLIAYAPWRKMRVGSCGQVVDRMELRIDSSDQQNEVGEILVRGDHVMQGYYKNEKATREAIDQDGWLHTGDLGVIDKDGFLYIRGRSKNMLLGASGQNIYPEEIESVLNNRAYVAESVVIERDGKLIALVHPDYDHMDSMKADQNELKKMLEKYRKQSNEILPPYMQVSKMVVYPEAFEKTPKQSIKRFLYKDVEV